MLTRLQHLLTVIARIATQDSALTREIHVESRLRLIPMLLFIGMLSAVAADASAADDRDVLVARGEYLVAVGFHPVSIVSSGKAV